MKFYVDSRELARAISPAVNVATTDGVKEHDYENLLTVKADDNGLAVFAFQGRTSLISMISDKNFGSLAYECLDGGKATINAFDLRDSLTTMEPGVVLVELVSNEVVVSLKSDKSSKRSMGTVTEVVQPPNVGKKFVQEIEVNRSVFTDSLHSVMFAPAVEEKMFSYMCVQMEAQMDGKKQVLRFSAGHGGRFAVKEVEGNNLFKADSLIKIIFPKDNLSNIHRVTTLADSDTIIVKTVEQDTKANIPEQIMIEFNGTVMCVYGLENFAKYPDLTKVIHHQYSNRIYSDLTGWNYAIGGVDMTYRGHNQKVHNTEVEFVVDDERFIVKPDSAHACTTPINIVDDQDCVATGEKIWFKCNSDYLKEMMQRSGKTGKIQLNFDSQETLNDIPKGQPKQMKPILVKFPERNNEAKGTKEKFFMFFTVSTK